jgi:hypothetical protein
LCFPEAKDGHLERKERHPEAKDDHLVRRNYLLSMLFKLRKESQPSPKEPVGWILKLAVFTD